MSGFGEGVDRARARARSSIEGLWSVQLFGS